MKILTICNFKGGVGKTTTAVNLGACLAGLGHKVLLVDLDPQGSLSEWYAYRHKPGQRTIYDALLDGGPLPYFRDAEIPGLYVTPSDVRLSMIEAQIHDDPNRSERLKTLLASSAPAVDFVIIDCPPAFGAGSTSALVTADYVICPTEATYPALSGMHKMLSFAERAMTRNPNLEILGAVFTRWKRTTANKAVAAEVAEAYPGLAFSTIIRENTAIAAAAAAHWPVNLYDPRSHGAEDYLALTKEVIERIEKIEKIETNKK